MMAYLILKVMMKIFMLMDLPYLYNTGQYGYPPSARIWFGQMCVWLFIISIVKGLLLLCQIHIVSRLSYVADKLFKGLYAYPNVELFVVMVLCPCLFNIIQFWISDSFLKEKKQTPVENDDSQFIQLLSMDSPQGTL